MSVGRRKSRNPQKWEEAPISDETEILGHSNLTEFQDGKDTLHGSSQRHNITKSSTSGDSSITGHEIIKSVEEKKLVRKQKNNLGNDGYSDSRGECSTKGSSSSANEMTVQDVLHSGRGGTLAECSICSTKYKDWDSVLRHIKSHRAFNLPMCFPEDKKAQKQSLLCKVCQKQFQRHLALLYHATYKHNLLKSPYVCPYCGQVFESASKLHTHIDINNVKMKCPVCSAVYSHEYELYSHLSECLSTFHPHLGYLICHVCSNKIKIHTLADHMIHHSLQDIRTKAVNPSNIMDSISAAVADITTQQPDNITIFLCEVCDEKFLSFEQFKSHLFKHSDSKKYCPLCFLKGFERVDFVVRHLMLRCPRRNADQFAFGSVLTSLGKYHNDNFLEILKDVQNHYPFQEGLETWSNVSLVEEFLKSFKLFTKEELSRFFPRQRLPAAAGAVLGNPTDIDLLSWLGEFESQLHASLVELHLASEVKVGRTDSFKNIPPKNLSERERSLLNENFNHLMKKENNGKPIEINFVVDGQVTITPCSSLEDAGHVSPLVTQKLPIEDLKKNHQEMAFLPEVDITTLKRLYDEAMNLVEVDLVRQHICRGGPVSEDDFIRLEWEAQYLRSKEPFYVRPDDSVKQLSSLYKSSVGCSSAGFSERFLLALEEEAKNNYLKTESFDAKRLLREISFGPEDVDRIMTEAQEA